LVKTLKNIGSTNASVVGLQYFGILKR